MSRIVLQDSMRDILLKVGEGNPGALRVCMDIVKEGKQIDPDNIVGGIGVLLSLDDMGIYGSRIWMFFKDVCGENLVGMLSVLRARQLGFISDTTINFAIDNYGKGIDVKDCYKKVKERLPKFANNRTME